MKAKTPKFYTVKKFPACSNINVILRELELIGLRKKSVIVRFQNNKCFCAQPKRLAHLPAAIIESHASDWYTVVDRCKKRNWDPALTLKSHKASAVYYDVTGYITI